MADTTGGFADARMAQLRAEGEVSMTGPNPPPRTLPGISLRSNRRRRFSMSKFALSIPARHEAPVPGPTAGESSIADTHPTDRR